MEDIVTADQLFQIVNPAALLGWIILIAGIAFKKAFWRDIIAGQVLPLAFAVVYTCLIIFFWFKTNGGFDTLAHVQMLFTSPWAALAGWVHYLAFDLFIGAHISNRVMDEGLPRLLLVALLPLTFLFGPIGYLCFHIFRLMFRRVGDSA
jgi:Domain of unknown function (DUF4281)